MTIFGCSPLNHFQVFVLVGKYCKKGFKTCGQFGPKDSMFPDHAYVARSSHTFTDLVNLQEQHEFDREDM